MYRRSRPGCYRTIILHCSLPRGRAETKKTHSTRSARSTATSSLEEWKKRRKINENNNFAHHRNVYCLPLANEGRLRCLASVLRVAFLFSQQAEIKRLSTNVCLAVVNRWNVTSARFICLSEWIDKNTARRLMRFSGNTFCLLVDDSARCKHPSHESAGW